MDDFDDSNAWATTSPTASPKLSLEKPVWAIETSQEPEQDEVNSSSSALDQLNLGSGTSSNEQDPTDGDFDEPSSGPSSLPAATAGANPATTIPGSNHHDQDDEFDEFGDFDDAAAPGEAAFGGIQGDEDDFDGFEEAPSGAFMSADAGGFTDEPQDVWEAPLKRIVLRPLPAPADLLATLSEALHPIFADRMVEDGLITSEPIRQAQGLTQLLTTESSRRLHADLTTPPPLLRPFDWKRSRVRREHLISLGIPVNLDEVSAPSTSLLPPLKITTLQAASEVTPRPVSATFTSKDRELPKRSSSAGPGPSSLAKRQTRNGGEESSLGERPEFNAEKAKRLLDYREDQLSLVPPKYLTRMQADLVDACASASALVAHLKQLKEIRADENKRKNAQIADLIAKAQRVKASEMQQSGGGLFRKGTVKRSSSGSNTPNRVGSPTTAYR